MSEYIDCINALIDVFESMINKADYSDLELICHKRIVIMDNIIYDCLFLMFHDYGYITAYEYERLQDKRIALHNKYIGLINGYGLKV